MVSIDTKHSELKKFYKLLSDLENHKPTNKIVKTEFWIMSINFTINTLILTIKYDSENLNERDQICFDPNQFKILGKQKSEWTEEKTKREMQKLIRFKIIKKEFEENNKTEMKNQYGLK